MAKGLSSWVQQRQAAHKAKQAEIAALEPLERLIKLIGLFGTIITALVAMFGVFKIFVDWSTLNSAEADRKLEGGIAAYVAAGARLKDFAQDGPNQPMLVASYRELRLMPRPAFRPRAIDWIKIGMPKDEEVDARLCPPRYYAIKMHVAFAKPVAKAEIDAFEAGLTQSKVPDLGGKTTEAVVKFDKACNAVILAEAEARDGADAKTDDATARDDLVTPIPASTPADASKTLKARAEQGVYNRKDYNAIGWDIDIFACANRRQDGQTLATALANVADEHGRIGGEVVGRVKLQALGGITSRAKFDAGDFVVGDTREMKLADAFALEVAKHGAKNPKATANTTAPTPWYLSITLCAA